MNPDDYAHTLKGAALYALARWQQTAEDWRKVPEHEKGIITGRRQAYEDVLKQITGHSVWPGESAVVNILENMNP